MRSSDGSLGNSDALVTRRHLGLGALASLIVQVAPLVAVTILSVVVARRLGPSGTEQ